MTHRFKTRLEQALDRGNYDALLDLVPYARLIGIECTRLGDELLFRLPANKDNIGNPILPALHGGVIAGFMELAAALHLLVFTGAPGLPKIIDFSWITCVPASFGTPMPSARYGARAGAWPTWRLPPGRALRPNRLPPPAHISRLRNWPALEILA